GARRRGRARHSYAVAGDDARLLEGPEGRERSLLLDVLGSLAWRMAARRLGAHRRRRLLVYRGAQRRHAEDRGQTSRSRGGGVGSGRASGGERGGGGRRAARDKRRG